MLKFAQKGKRLTMALRKILHYPNSRLRIKAKPVENFDKELQRLIDDMFETMYEDHGGGLAATQLDVQLQVIVIDPNCDKKNTYVLINPEVLETSGAKKSEEGCLSVPGIFETVERAEYVKVKAFDRHGNEFIIESRGDYLAACLQHEVDHLNGKLFVDYLSPLRLRRAKQKMKKLSKVTL